ncbi:MAG TPA: MotA/TolQ/ExbB proton channel family protein [Steroidobacteraceae bacterium]|nr:MotA/TolQ/ExbB proton channel family protein [Steroidobacteraceae bacterium]
MDIFYPIVRFFTAGGAFMFPILLTGAVAAAITIERWATLTKMRARNQRTWSRVEPAIASGDFDKARELVSKDESPIAHMLGMGLALQGAVRRREDVEKAMQESMIEIVPQLEKRTHYLATLANVATLLGLLGTVSGLIHAFAAVATVNPAEKANLLSASISEAMNCTAFGLMTAVPILVLHAFLQSKTMGLNDGLEAAAIRFLNAVAARQAARAQSRLELVQQAASAA